jgi:hypothetical protein
MDNFRSIEILQSNGKIIEERINIDLIVSYAENTRIDKENKEVKEVWIEMANGNRKIAPMSETDFANAIRTNKIIYKDAEMG